MERKLVGYGRQDAASKDRADAQAKEEIEAMAPPPISREVRRNVTTAYSKNVFNSMNITPYVTRYDIRSWLIGPSYTTRRG